MQPVSMRMYLSQNPTGIHCSKLLFALNLSRQYFILKSFSICFIKVKALLPEQLILYIKAGAELNEIFPEIFFLIIFMIMVSNLKDKKHRCLGKEKGLYSSMKV